MMWLQSSSSDRSVLVSSLSMGWWEPSTEWGHNKCVNNVQTHHQDNGRTVTTPAHSSSCSPCLVSWPRVSALLSPLSSTCGLMTSDWWNIIAGHHLSSSSRKSQPLSLPGEMGTLSLSSLSQYLSLSLSSSLTILSLSLSLSHCLTSTLQISSNCYPKDRVRSQATAAAPKVPC